MFGACISAFNGIGDLQAKGITFSCLFWIFLYGDDSVVARRKLHCHMRRVHTTTPSLLKVCHPIRMLY